VFTCNIIFKDFPLEDLTTYEIKRNNKTL